MMTNLEDDGSQKMFMIDGDYDCPSTFLLNLLLIFIKKKI